MTKPIITEHTKIGEEIIIEEVFEIEEEPKECVLSKLDKNGNYEEGLTLRISSPEDAILIIQSLKKMLRLQYLKSEIRGHR